MQHLGRTDTIQNIAIPKRLPLLADIFRQRFTRRDTAAQSDIGFPVLIQIGQHRRIKRWHAAKDAGLMRTNDVDDRVRRRASIEQHSRRANRHRKGHPVAQAIGKEQFRSREDFILRANLQHLSTIGIRGCAQAGMHMAHALGLACGTR